MSQEKDDPFKEGVFDLINLGNKLDLETSKRNWDFGIFGVSAVVGSFLASNLNTEPGTLLRVVTLLGTASIAALGLGMSVIRGERIAYIRGQMEGIEKQALRTASLGDSSTSFIK